MVPMMQMTVLQRHRASYLEVAVDHHLPWDNVVVVVHHKQQVADLLPILGVAVDHRVPPMMVAAEVHSPVAVRDSNSHVLPRDDAVVAVDSNSVHQHYCVVVEEHVLDDDSSREEHDEEEDADSHSNQTNWVARVGVPSKHHQHLVVVDPGNSARVDHREAEGRYSHMVVVDNSANSPYVPVLPPWGYSLPRTMHPRTWAWGALQAHSSHFVVEGARSEGLDGYWQRDEHLLRPPSRLPSSRSPWRGAQEDLHPFSSYCGLT